LIELWWMLRSRARLFSSSGAGPDLFQQLPDHAPDPHDLGGLLDHLHDRPLARVLTLAVRGVHRDAVRAHHHNFRALAGLGVAFAHAS